MSSKVVIWFLGLRNAYLILEWHPNMIVWFWQVFPPLNPHVIILVRDTAILKLFLGLVECVGFVSQVSRVQNSFDRMLRGGSQDRSCQVLLRNMIPE